MGRNLTLTVAALSVGLLVLIALPTNAFSTVVAPKKMIRRKQQAKIIANSTRKRFSGTSLSFSSSSPDDRTVSWTVANLFQVTDTLLVIYHAAGTAWDNLVPFGALLGAIAYQIGLYQPYPTLLQSAGDAAWWTGLIVMALGVMKLFLLDVRTIKSMSAAAEELKGDYNKRVMDQSAWIGCGVAAVVLGVAGGPSGVGLAAGADGVIQGLCLGTVAGSGLGWWRQE